MEEALRALGLDPAKGKVMGGITGAIARWAPTRGVTVPIQPGKDDEGRRYWRWAP